MGCCSSKDPVLDVLTTRYGATLMELELTRQAKVFFKLFKAHDEDNSGTIDLVELLDLLGSCKRDIFAKRDAPCAAQTSTKRHSTGELSKHLMLMVLDFREMVFCIYNLCTLDAVGLLMLIFDLYDTDASGSMTVDELTRLIQDVHHANKTSKVVKRLTERLRTKYSGQMGKRQFVEFGRANSQFMLPALETQRVTRSAVIGEGFWKDRTRKRNAKKESKWRPENWIHLRSTLMSKDISERAKATQRRQAGAKKDFSAERQAKS